MDQVTFADVLQKSFIAMSMGSANKITTLNILTNITMSFLVGMFIFYIYKKTFQGVLYQWSFNVSLVLATAVTSLVIMTISGNIVLSLGMVGALSIVRFRTPVKDSIDLIFLFWAISAGIANGVGYYNISVAGSVLIAIFLLILNRKRYLSESYLLVLKLSPDSNTEDVIQAVKTRTRSSSVKSKSLTSDSTELTIEVSLVDKDTAFVDSLVKDGKAKQATLITYEQEYSSI